MVRIPVVRRLARASVIAALAVGLTANSASASTARFPAMNYRGSSNNWGTTPMTLVANNTWQLNVALTSGTAYTFKFDASKVWAVNQYWGARFTGSASSGTALLNGTINLSYTPSTTGTFTFQFNDSTLAYSIFPAVVSSSTVTTYGYDTTGHLTNVSTSNLLTDSNNCGSPRVVCKAPTGNCVNGTCAP